MVESRGSACLPHHPLAQVLARARGGDDLLQRDGAVQDVVVREPDDTHAALAQRLDEPVSAADHSSGRRSHGR